MFGVTILNPLRLDWRQRISLAIAISALAYFVAHTIHKPPATSAPDQRLVFLEQQVESLRSQQHDLTTRAENSEKEKQRRQVIRGQLAVFMKEGQTIKDGLQYNNSSSLHAKADWERRVDEYLIKNLDESYAIRFRSPSHQVNSYPLGMSTQMLAAWAEVAARMVMLNDFIAELRD